MHITASDTPRLISGEKLLPLRDRLARSPERDGYTQWAKRVLGLDGMEK